MASYTMGTGSLPGLKRPGRGVWNVMAHAQKSDFAFRRNGPIHLNRRGRQFSRLLAAEVCASAVVMVVTPCSEVVWRVRATHSIRQFPLHFPSRASPCDVTFRLDSTSYELFILVRCWWHSWGRGDMQTGSCWRNLRAKGHLEGFGEDGKIIFN